MILKALADYYDRMLHDESLNPPPYGFEDKPIPFLLVIDGKGALVNIRDTRTGTGKTKVARCFRVPQGEKKTSGIKENLLWDNPQYVLGVPKSNSAKDIEKARDAVDAFIKRLREDLGDLADDRVKALFMFYGSREIATVRDHELFPAIMEENANITFLFDGDTELIAQRPVVVDRIKELFEKGGGTPQACAISGEKDSIAVLHTAIKGVWKAQTSGANIVSFNDDAYCSYGRTKNDQGLNAPIGRHNEFAYTTALNILLASEQQRFQVGDSSTVFWAKEGCDLESDLPAYLNPKKGEEAVSYDKIRSLLKSARTGIPPQEGEIPFYVLGLAPNASRLSVRFWYNGSVKEVKERMAQHFADIEIVRAPHDLEFVSLFQLLVSTATEHKADNIPPNLGGDVMRAVLTGGAYPRTLLTNAIRRCKAEQKIDYQRASLIKGVLARQARLTKATTKEVGVSLDREYGNIGYVLGRLFAVLERIQEQAQGRGLNKTIRDTYFGAAASSPLVTFKRLQDLAIHHLAKIRNGGKNTVWLERQLQEVMDLVPPQGIPSIMGLEDQGRFAVGYYHQRQDFFTKKDTVEVETTTEGEDA